ncbi:MAG: undecaprenyldiphospho-muramoylpentapeptide beta-N-acetylglucosaminyltransferase [Gilvibacter sp.]
MKPYRFILSGGGTGGHIYPAIAIANALKRKYPDAEFLFVGAKDRMEMQKVPKAGYPIKGLWISGLQRKTSLKNLSFPFKLISSLIASKKILKEFKPDVAIGTGGYASAPLLRTASKKGVPCLIQEQNSHAGITNKWLAKKVDTICVAYPEMEQFFPAQKIVQTGNPVRDDLVDIKITKKEGCAHFGLDANKPVLLVIGGSLGARRINQLIAAKKDFFARKGVQVLWQCGSFYYEEYKDLADANLVVKDFIYEMDKAYASANFIISRAGALSVSELCLVGKPTVFIPSPNVAEDHQTKNAMAIAKEDACLVIREQVLDSEFELLFNELFKCPNKQSDLAQNIKKLARPNATQDIVTEVERLLSKTKVHK